MNYQLLHAINCMSGHSGILDTLMVFCAKYLIYLLFAGLVAAAVPFLRTRQWHTLGCAAAALLGTFALGLLVSAVFYEPRPFTTHPGLHVLTPHAPGQSFPSDHATAAFAIAFVLLAYADRRWGLLALSSAVLIGIARVYAGVHYPGDIAGAAILAAITVGAVVLIARRTPRRAVRPVVAGGAAGTPP